MLATLRRTLLPLAIASGLAAGCGSKNAAGPGQPPTVQLTAPAIGSSVSAVGFFVRATATDDQAVVRVDFEVDAAVVAQIAAPPYEAFVTSLGLDTTRVHTVTATAYDAGNRSTTAAITVSIQPRRYRQLTLSEQGKRHVEPAWNPFGTEVAFATEGTALNSAKTIAVISVNGGTPTPITSTLLQDGNPTWSPDGSWIAFESNRTSTYQIWAASRAAGTNRAPIELTVGLPRRRPSWGEGTGGIGWIIFESDQSVIDPDALFMIQVGTSADLVSILQDNVVAEVNNTSELAPAWSHQDFAATNSNRFGAYGVILINPFLSSTPQPVAGASQSIVETEASSFSPDDASLAFTDNASGKKVFVVPLTGDGSVRYEVAPGSLGFPDSSDPAWSPDGRRIAFVSTRTGVAEIWILESE